MKRDSALAVLAAALLLASPVEVSGQEVETRPSVEGANLALRCGALTFSPAHLAFRVIELSAEIRLANRLSVAAILGVGQERRTGCSPAPCPEGRALEFGGQVRYYLTGNVDGGIHVGAELLSLSLDKWHTTAIALNGEGASLGPFVGYKLGTGIGFTAEAQLGVLLVAPNGSAASACGGSCSAKSGPGILLANLNVGWAL